MGKGNDKRAVCISNGMALAVECAAAEGELEVNAESSLRRAACETHLQRGRSQKATCKIPAEVANGKACVVHRRTS